MRGLNYIQSQLFSYLSPERRVPEGHPLRRIKIIADEALKILNGSFNEMYSEMGRPSIPPERLLKSWILMALYSVRSDRLFCEMLDYNILFRWFLDMNMDEAPFDHSSFSKNRERLLEHEVAVKFFDATVGIAKDKELISDEHFSVDGTLIEAWASLKSFRLKNENREKDDRDSNCFKNSSIDFHGEKRSNETHESKTDSEALLMRKGKGKEAKLCFSGHFLMENRNGLCVDLKIKDARTRSEKQAAGEMINRQRKKKRNITTLGADKGYHSKDFVSFLRKKGIKPHIAQVENRKNTGLDGRTTRHKGYQLSQTIRKRVEEIIGWAKTVGNFRRSRFKGIERTQHALQLLTSS